MPIISQPIKSRWNAWKGVSFSCVCGCERPSLRGGRRFERGAAGCRAHCTGVGSVWSFVVLSRTTTHDRVKKKRFGGSRSNPSRLICGNSRNLTTTGPELCFQNLLDLCNFFFLNKKWSAVWTYQMFAKETLWVWAAAAGLREDWTARTLGYLRVRAPAPGCSLRAWRNPAGRARCPRTKGGVPWWVWTAVPSLHRTLL